MSAKKAAGIIVFLAIAAAVGYVLYGVLVTKEFSPTLGIPDILPGGGQISEAEVRQHFEAKGFEFWGAQASGGEYAIEVNTDLVPEDLLATSMEDACYAASYVNGKQPAVDTITLDVYYTGWPFYRVSGPVSAMADAYDNGDEGFLDSVSVEDLRPLDFKIKSDLWMFDYLVEVTSLDETSVSVTLMPYHQSTAGMANDLTAMAFIIIQEAPFLDTLHFTVDYGATSVAVTLQTQDVLAYMNGDTTLEELMSGAGMSQV